MCYNCEGEVDLDVIVCPFCAADLREEKPEQQRSSYSAAVSTKNREAQESLYPSHFKSPPEPQETPEPQGVAPAATTIQAPSEDEGKGIFGPTALLALGIQLLVFGLLLSFFSHKGYMLLKWDARLWFLYIFASVPFLIFGYKAWSKL